MKIFKTKRELLKEWKANGACRAGVDFNKNCKSLKQIIETCPKNFRIWRICKGYLQFAEDKYLKEFNESDWIIILSRCAELADKFDKWDKFDIYDWYKLLERQPQFYDKFDEFSLINKEDWEYFSLKRTFLSNNFKIKY